MLEMRSEMGVTRELAAWATETGFESMPAVAVERARAAIIDTVGVILAGTEEPVTRIVAEVAAADACRPVASQLGTRFKTSPESAALLNGVSGHALDFDDVSASVEGHPSVVILPAALAAAELVDASGRELLEAFAIGVEVMAKLGLAIGPAHYQAGWHATSTLGTLGAAVVAGRLLGLDVDRLQMAIAIAVSEASGSRQNFGTMTKPFHAGHAARCGVQAARLAARGMTASAEALEGPLGYFTLFSLGEGQVARVVAPLGRPWDLEAGGLSVKKYPCCFAMHRAADGVLGILSERAISHADVEEVTVTVPHGGLAPLIYDRASTGLEGKFCMSYAMAAALLDGRLGLETFTDAMVCRPEVRRLEELVRVREDPGVDVRHSPFDEGHVVVEVRLRDGSRSVRRVDQPLGSPARPLSLAQLEAKYRDCARTVLDAAGMDRSLATLEALETLPHVSALVAQLTPVAEAVRL
jgi:2-methylcitrate dehydratase PrpD